MSKEKNKKNKISKTSKYPELNDLELEIVCGGSSFKCFHSDLGASASDFAPATLGKSETA